MTNNFKKAYREIEAKIKSDKDLLRSVDLIALLGSVADKEESDDWSDLDVLVVLKSDGLGNISLKDLGKLQRILAEVSRRYKFPISILSHTIDDFEKYVSFEYLKHYSFGFCVYPSSDYLRKIIGQILAKRKIGEVTRKAYCAYHMRHIRFNLLRKYISLNEHSSPNFRKEFTKFLIDKMIKVTDLALNYIDLWPKNKKEILDLAKKNLNINMKPLKEALEIRSGWTEIDNEELMTLIPNGTNYLLQVINLVLKEYQVPTPEEKMSA